MKLSVEQNKWGKLWSSTFGLEQSVALHFLKRSTFGLLTCLCLIFINVKNVGLPFETHSFITFNFRIKQRGVCPLEDNWKWLSSSGCRGGEATQLTALCLCDWSGVHKMWLMTTNSEILGFKDETGLSARCDFRLLTPVRILEEH